MTTEEAFIKVLQLHGIEHAFGIIGSAMMPVSDMFSRAGITFWDCAHEANAGLMCDGYSRATGRIAMAIAQNGPGVTGFVTAVKTAYWNHTPMLLVTPQAANKTMGQGGFQEVPQMALFQDMVCWQEEVRDPANAALSSHVLLGILDPADELVTRQRRDVLPRSERLGVGDQRHTQICGQLVHHAARHSLAAHGGQRNSRGAEDLSYWAARLAWETG